MSDFYRISSIADLHETLGLEPPRHPLVSLIDYTTINPPLQLVGKKLVIDFYLISAKGNSGQSISYGQEHFDFRQGSMIFMAPGQVFSALTAGSMGRPTGWGLYFHPDLIRGYVLAERIDNYRFFTYAVTEALRLSDREAAVIQGLFENVRAEYRRGADYHVAHLITENIGLLLSYSQRFYERQLQGDSTGSNGLVSRFEQSLRRYFADERQLDEGLAGLDYFARELRLSPAYLSDLIKQRTGRTVVEQVHAYVLESAKRDLLGTTKTVNEIAYSLGFNYPQYFSRLFKAKVGVTPSEFRDRVV